MSAKVTCAAVVGGIAAIGAIAAIFTGGEDDKENYILNEEKMIDWSERHQAGEQPPKPEFNIYDGDKCRSTVGEYFENAANMWEYNKKSEAKMQASMQELLDMQTDFDFDIVQNEAFRDWTTQGMMEIPPDMSDELQIAWNAEMIAVFGNRNTRVPVIRSVEEMRNAMQTLYWYRVDLGLEYPVMFDMLYIDPSEYMMCSVNTQELGRIYTQDYMSSYCCNESYINLPPMIENLNKWMQKTYSRK